MTYAPFVAPPRPRSYAQWGKWAAPSLRLALRGKQFDLVHAHYAAPAGDAVRRLNVPYVVSVHGGDVLGVATRWKGGEAVVRDALRGARLVLANSGMIAERCRAARRPRRARGAPGDRRSGAHAAQPARSSPSAT